MPMKYLKVQYELGQAHVYAIPRVITCEQQPWLSLDLRGSLNRQAAESRLL